MNIYEALKKDHRTVDTLLNQLVQASESGNDQWRTIIDQIRDELIPHARAEEAVFYNALRESEEGKGLMLHAYGEHAMAETELRTLQAMSAIDANWTTLAKKLRDDITHHVEEEEGKIFTAARKAFSEEEAEAIGNAFEQLKPMIKNQSIMSTTLEMVANTLPPRISQAFWKSFQEAAQSRGKAA